MAFFVDISTKKTRQSLALHSLYLRSILEKLENFISSVHCKEGRSHQDIDEQEGSYSWYPRVEEVKTVTKESWTKGC